MSNIIFYIFCRCRSKPSGVFSNKYGPRDKVEQEWYEGDTKYEYTKDTVFGLDRSSKGMHNKLAAVALPKPKSLEKIPKREVLTAPEQLTEVEAATCTCARKCLAALPGSMKKTLRQRWCNYSIREKSSAMFGHMMAMKHRALERKNTETAVETEIYGEQYREKTSRDSNLQHYLIDPRFDHLTEEELAESRKTRAGDTNQHTYPVCVKALRYLTASFSGTSYSKILKLVEEGDSAYFGPLLEHRQVQRDLRTKTRAQLVVIWVEEELFNLGERDPTDNQKCWTPYSTRTEMHEAYKKDVEVMLKFQSDFNQTKAVSLSYFTRIIKRTYGEKMKIGRKHMNFTKCSYCCKLKELIRKAGASTPIGKGLQLHYYRHLTWVALNKQKYYHHRTKARCMFKQNMSIIMDACDQSNIDVPYLKDNPKNTPTKLATKMGAVVVHSSDSTATQNARGGAYLFHIDERVTKGANFWITCLTKVLNDERAKRGGVLPAVITIQMDSAGDNKNYTLASWCEWLVKVGMCRKVKMCFLPVGHTHEDIDALFGRLSQQFVQHGSSNVQNLTQMLAAAKSANAQTMGIWNASVGVCVCVCVCVTVRDDSLLFTKIVGNIF